MIQHQAHILIRRPVDQVFAFLSHKANDLQWQGGLVEVQQSPGAAGVGTQITEVHSYFGQQFEHQYKITEYEAGQKMAAQSTGGPFPIQYCYTLQPAKEGTDVTFNFEMEPEGFFAIAAPVFKAYFKQAFGTNLAALKRALEK